MTEPQAKSLISALELLSGAIKLLCSPSGTAASLAMTEVAKAEQMIKTLKKDSSP